MLPSGKRGIEQKQLQTPLAPQPPQLLLASKQQTTGILAKQIPQETMVLAELGGKLRESLRKLHTRSGHVTAKQLNQVLSEVARALIEADVSVKLVMTLRDNVKQKVEKMIEDEEDEDDEDKQEQRASNVSKLVQKAVVDELVSLLEPNRKPYSMKRGKANVILFVGLQGAGKTTTIAKYANYYQRRGWKTAMVCADTFRYVLELDFVPCCSVVQDMYVVGSL